MKNLYKSFTLNLVSPALFTTKRTLHKSPESIVSTSGKKVSSALFRKSLHVAITTIFLWVVTTSSGSAQTLGTYAFNSAGGATCATRNVSVNSQPANAVFSTYANVGGTCSYLATGFLNTNLNTSQTIDLTEYNTFTITANTGFFLTLNSVTFTQLVSKNGTSGGTGSSWVLRSNIDGYTADLGTGTSTTVSQTATVNLPSATFTNIGLVTFRLYLINTKDNATTWTNEDVSVTGQVNAVPANPANPTSNSPQCNPPGVTLTRSGVPPGGQTWYWQTTATGTSTAGSAATYNVTTSGTYYIRAQNNTTLLWSTGAGSLAVTVTPNVGATTFTAGASSVRCQAAGPVTYTATSSNTTGITYSLDAASIAAGNSINAANGTVTYTAAWTGSSTITATAAGCSPTTATHTATTNAPVTIPVFVSGATSTRCQGAATITYTANAANTTGITYTLDAASATGGNTIVAATGAVTFAAGWSGTTTVTAIAAGCTGPKTSTHTITITPTVTTPVFVSGASSTRCQAAGPVTYTANATNTTGITYTLDAASVTGGNSINAATGAVTYVATWSGTSIITASAAGCSGPLTSTHTVTITPIVGTPVFALGAASTRCQAAGPVTYTATASNATGITYSLDAASVSAGNSMNTANGTVTYTAAWTGTSIITASAAGCSGPKTSTHTVTTNAPVTTPVFVSGASSTRCQGVATVTYTANAANTTGITYTLDAASTTGGNTIVAATGAVTYAAGWSGTTTITVSAAGCSGPKTAIHTVTITPTAGTPVFVSGASSTRCQAAGPVTYTANATNTTGITYFLDAASIAGGNSIVAATGAVTYAAAWSGTSIITASAAGCNGPMTSTHTVTVTPIVGTPVFALGTTSTRCQAAGPVTYTATAASATSITYSLDAASIAAGNSIVAANGTVTYTAAWTGTSIITASAAGCSGPKTSTHTVTITPTVTTPVFVSGASSTRCQAAGAVTYTANASNTTGITYTLDAASITGGNTIVAATGAVTYAAGWSGTSIITASAAGCSGPKTSTHTVTITPTVATPVFVSGASSTRCQAAGAVTYSANATNTSGITYSLDAASIAGGNTIVGATGAVTYTAAWTGTSIITASAAGCSGPQTSTHTVSTTALVGTPVFALGATSTRCQGAATINYSASATNTTSITYSLNAPSISAGNFINSTTGDVTYTAGYAGTTIITASAAGCSGPKTATHTVTVTATVGTPVFAAGASSVRCEGSGTVTYTATATTNTGITYSLSAAGLAGGNTINSATGAVTYSAAWASTLTITATATGCNGPSSSVHTVTTTPIVGVPVFAAGSASVRCQGAGTVTYTANATNTTGITYTLDAASITGGNTIVAATGAVTYAASWSGATTITASAAGCSGPKTSIHTVTVTATVGVPVFAMGASSSRCFANETINYSATATANTGITYSLDATSLSAGNTINNSIGDVSFNGAWIGTSVITATATGCNGPKTSTHTVTTNGAVTVPVFSAGASSVICQASGTVIYSATALYTSGISYSLDAASTAGGNTINASTGVVSYAAGWSGTSVITATAAGCYGPQTASHNVTITPTVGTPAFSRGATSTRCQGAGNILYDASATTTTGITYSLDAATTAGGNTINASTGEVTYAATWSGTTIITASAAGCNGLKTATHTVTVTPTVGIPVFVIGATSTRCQRAETVIYNATAGDNTGITYDLDAASVSAGNTIDPATGIVTYVSSWTGTSNITATATGCNGPSTSVHAVTITPIVGTPAFALGSSSVKCQGAGTVSYTASADNTTGITYSLDAASIAGGNTINASDGRVTYSATWSGTTTITANAAGCSPQSVTHTVTVTGTVGVPVFAKGVSSSRCFANETINYSAAATTNTGIIFSLDATSLAAGNTIDASTGDVTYLDTWIGTSTITATATGCNGPKTAIHTVTTNGAVTVPVFAAGSSSVICQASGTVTYTATASYTSGITYSLDAASTAGGNSINISTGAVAYAATWAGTSVITATAAGCYGPQTANHTVTITPTVGTPVFAIGATSTRCQGAGTVMYNADATTTTGITYSLDAASTAGGNTINASTGEVTYAATWSGTTIITASAAGCNGPKTAAHTVTVTPTVGVPVFVIGASSTRCQTAEMVTYNATASDNTGITYDLDAASISGGNTIDNTTGIVTYISYWTGTSTITATATGCNGPSSSVHTVTTTPTVEVPIFSSGSTSVRCQGAATISYTASATDNTGMTYSLDFSSRSAGNTINSSTGSVDYAAGWSGTSIITASAAGCNGPKTSTHTVTVTATVSTPVFTMGASSGRCYGAGVVRYSATAAASTGITYSLDGSSITAGNTINSATGDVTFDAAWIGTSVITALATGCKGPTASTHTATTNGAVTASVFSAGSSSVRCQGGGTVSYSASATNSTGITYSLDVVSRTAGNTINAATGSVTYLAGWSGTSTITASAAGCYGPQTSIHTVTITPTVSTPVFTLGASSVKCQGAETINYSATAANSTGVTYTLNLTSRNAGNTINTSTGDVTYVAGYVGTSIITATATGCNGPKTATHTVTVNPSVAAPVFTSGVSSTRCQGAGTITYTATATNTTGITYNLDVASLAAGNSVNSGTGAVTFDVNWAGTTVITANANGCNGPKNSTHTVTVTPTVGAPVFSLGTTSIRCQASAIIRYSATATNSTKITYKLDNTSYNFGANDYDPNTGDVLFDAAWSGTSTITATAIGCNGPVISIHTVTITPTVGTPVFALGASSTRCVGAGTVNYTANATNSTGITYSLDATSRLAGNTINAATGDVTFAVLYLGNSTITATAAGCNGPKSSTHTVSSTASVTTPVFASGLSSVRCQGAATVTYSASASNTSGITYSLDAASTAAGNFIKPNAQLTYVAGWSGTTIITASAAGCNGPATATHTVTITPPVSAPVFSSGSTSTRCQGAGTVNYSAPAANSTGITYSIDAASGTGGNSINSATGNVTYVAGWSGTSIITASAAGCSGPATASHTVTINPTVGTPVFTLGALSTRCQGAGPVTYTATATTSTGITYSMDAASTAAGNSINSANGTVIYTAAWAGTTTITATATGCNGPKASTHTVTITSSVTTPVFSSGGVSTRCQVAGNVTYTATATNSTGIIYSLDAASLGAGNSIASATGVVTYTAGWSGTSVITASAAGCNGPKTAQHTVTITPDGTPNFILSATSTRCQSALSVTYTASNSNNSGVTYSLDAASIAGGNSINSATGLVTYLASWTGTTQITSTATGCNGVKTAVHTVTIIPNGTPVFAMGDVSTRLQSAGVVRYSATSNNGAAVAYSLDAASLAGNNKINPATGDVTYVASWGGTTIITATVSGCNGNVPATHTVTMNSSVVNKQLYLSDPSQALDRIDPVAKNDLTTSSSATLGTSGSAGFVSVDNNASNSANGTSVTISNFVTGAGNNRLMLVGVALDATVTAVTYGGQNLTRVSSIGAGRPRVEIWQLLNPSTGTANVVVTTNVNGSIKAGVTTFAGVDPATPIRLPVTALSGNSTPSATITSAVNELVYDVIGINNDPTATASAGQTQSWNIRGVFNMTGAASTKPGAASVVMSWATSTNPNAWSQIALSLRPAPTAITSTTFTQSPALCLPLTIKAANNIVVTNYVNIVSGVMPAAPNLTAVLRYGATAIITLKNPTYNSGTGLVTWTGSLAKDSTVPSGQAISLDITTAQAGVTFTISYDSKTKPSKIDLPVSTYIDISSLNVYTAPYSAGSQVISAIAGAVDYVRATVSDPFGFSDINGVDITFLPSGVTKTAVSVDTIGCTQVFETVWNTAGAMGNYNISATAKEGFENRVTSIQSTSFYFCTTCPPVAMPDSAVGAGGTPLLIDVLANDYDPNNNIKASSLAITSQPSNGTALLSGGKIVYLPNGDFSGRDTLTYQICDLTSPTSLCAIGQIYADIDPTIVDPCSDAAKSHIYYIPFPEQDARTALLASQNVGLVINSVRTIISLKMPYPNMKVIWDQWEDGYETNLLNSQQSTTLIWGDGNPYNGIAPGYSNDIIPAGGSIVLDNTMPVNPRVATNFFFDGRDKVYSSGQITMTQVSGEPATIGLQAMKTNITSTTDFGTSFTIPAGDNVNSRDFTYTALFIRASTNNTVVNIDKDADKIFETTTTLNEGQSLLINGGVETGATIIGSAPIGIDLHFGGVDNYSSREVPVYPATWYSNVYYTPVPTTKSPDSAVVMLYNSLGRPIKVNWSSGAPASGVITLPSKSVVRFPLALSNTFTYKFVNPTGEAFTAIEIVDSYSPGSTTNMNGPNYDWAFNLISEPRLTTYATIAWAPGSTNGSRNDNPIWVTPAGNTTIYVKYNGDVLNGGKISPSGLHYDTSYLLNALNYLRILDPDRDQSGIAIYTSDGTKIAAVYGEDASSAVAGNPSWDVGTTIQPFCSLKLMLANDDYGYTMTNRPVTINILQNDGGFQSQIDPSSVITNGYLQPKHGTVSVNSDGTLLYMPDAGYTGLDSLEYNVCSTPSPVVCDVAMVVITVAACPTPTGQNIIAGQVFIDKNKDGINNDGGDGFPNAKIYLYTDGNCSGTISANELKDSVMVDNSGSYQFRTYPEKTVEDDFDGAGGTSTCASGTDGTAAWLTNWTDSGDPSIGYCVSPAQSYSNTDVEIVKDGAFSYALRLKDNNVSATRSVNLSGATAAYLSFSYRRAKASLTAGKDVLVQASANGVTWTTIFTVSGNGISDAAYVNVYNQNLLAYASATAYIRFLTNGNVNDPDEVFIDNISITYLKYPICYITKVDPSAIIPNYQFTTVSQNAMTANGGGTCLFPFDYGIVKNSIAISGNLYNDANGLTDNLVNGTAIGTPSGAVIYAYLVDSVGKVAFKTTVNNATGAYSFPLADVLVNYTVVLSTSDSALYDPAPPSANLPAGWVSAGDAYGTVNGAGSGNKAGIATSSIAVKTALANITGVNFGIEQLPFAGSGSNTAIDKGGTNSVIFPANTFTNTLSGSDPSPGNITSIRITIFPAKATTMTINGTGYNFSNFPLAGVVIPANATGQPTQTITVDPVDGYVKVLIPFYTIDNAGKESKATGTAVIRFLLDTDNDGVADIYDIDDENDGITDYVELCGNGAITFSCLPGGSDPSEDNDDDGILNYKDADFGPLNAAGCLASIDSDGDGIPHYLDMDSDNDGIPDVVEAYGTDANGDGIIDNFTDTDGDGLSQNVDANITGAGGSGQGLGFKDYDGDGIPNTKDLDSDNDGIPDIAEAGGTDPNNDGRVSTFTDANGNGLNDTNELAGALLKTGADTNNDGRPESYPNKNADQTGYPNPYDLDCDGDGITDVVEAGFPNTITYLNGVVTGVYTNGWANTAQALPVLTLVNTDARGLANYLDIDSDDDGISDNIEGQATATYKVPTDTDIDNDGLADTYDNNTAAYGGAGITLNDQDSDGIPDMLDTDTDNDGKPDLNEASKNSALTQATINTADADGDGLLDEFDILNLNLIAAGSKYQNVTDAKMGANGSFTGPATSGSNVTLVRTYTSEPDRDWRNYNILTLGDLVWYDFNNNGLYDAGETKISGATVNLYADANGDNVPDGTAIASTVTDAAGTFTFVELSKTKYIAGVVLPAGYTLGTAIASSANPNNGTDNDNNGVTLAGSEVRTNSITLAGINNTLDIGLKGSGSIGDFVFNDTNGNGIQDAGETGIAGAKVSITFPNGFIANTLTNASGLYSFTGLGDGTYPLTFSTPAGYIASTPLQGSNVTKDSDPVGGSVSVTITAAQVRTDIDAGFYLPYTLGNAVWYDFNNNGLKDVNEPVISGATVKLYKDVNGDNAPDGAPVATVITDLSANYSFTGLQSGNYIIGLMLPPGYAMGTGIASSSNPNNNTDNDNNGINLASGEVRTNYISLSSSNNTLDIGLKGTGSIGDFVFNDANGNGLQEADETGLSGVIVKLTAQNGATYIVTTSASGRYSFKGLIAGTYSVDFATPAGYIASDAAVGTNRSLDSDPVNGTVSVTIGTDEFNADIDAGFYLPYTIGNLVFVDLNNNGLKDAGETGVSGVTVRLYADDNGDNIADGAAQATATTDGAGAYQFTGLSSGNYIVGVLIPAAYTAGTTTASSATPGNNIDNDNNGVNLTAGEERSNFIYLSGTNNTLDFGFKGSGSIGDFVWLDANGDGIQQAGENGIPDVTVTLTSSGGVTSTTVTDANGKYNFGSLIPGTYTLHFATPSVPNAPVMIPYISRKATQGGNTSLDSDPNPATGNVTVTIAIGEVNMKIDAAFAEDQDDDNDGIANAIENLGYQPFKDCDGDGIPNYLDASPGCATNPGTDLFGNLYKPLVWKDLNNDGISDFFDLDLDGILNELDLDSDNDGIPDIREAHDNRATDANNDGMADGADSDGDGILSSADQNDNDYGDEGLMVTDLERDGKPGFLDIDSDGDGIGDATEAGYPGSVIVVNGKVTGASANGWATSAKALGNYAYRNSDGRGYPDYYDIDADDDGITDNIEGQSTGSYIVPTDADTDGDGLCDVYDVSVSLFGGGGITPYDHDADGTPDYFDKDTDNDGALDINEASRDFALKANNINVNDADGDGLVDQYDLLNISLLSSNLFKNVTNSQMGAQGSYNGPLPSGSNVKVVGNPSGTDRDWRASYILPLTITSFSGTLQNNQAQLTWKVSNDQQTDHYLVQRSENALSFAQVANVKALNRVEQVYNYGDDLSAYAKDVVYYRIIQVGKNGELFYSKIIALRREKKEAITIKVYPNPVMNVLTIKINSLTRQTAAVVVYDAAGKQLLTKSLLLNQGENECKLTEVSRLLQGFYTLEIITTDKSYTQKLIKE